jgi:hypothetical protein
MTGHKPEWTDETRRPIFWKANPGMTPGRVPARAGRGERIAPVARLERARAVRTGMHDAPGLLKDRFSWIAVVGERTGCPQTLDRSLNRR